MERPARPIAEPWSGLGVNCMQPSDFWYNYKESTGEPFIPYVIDNFSRVRIFCDLNSETSRTAIHTWALQLKRAKPDIHILYGATRHPITPQTMEEHKTLVLEEAQWAEDNGMDEFQVSNELENNPHDGLTDAQLRIFVRGLADEVKQVFTRPISYAVAQGREDGWITEGMGNLDRLSFNIYGHNGTEASFRHLCEKVYGAFGDLCFISEWNLHPVWYSTLAEGISPGYGGFEEAYAREIARRKRIIEEVGISEAYFFTLWSFSEGFGIDHFSVYKRDTGFRTAFEPLMEVQRIERRPETRDMVLLRQNTRPRL